ncbi:hypothetical protein F5Y18DRAFT_431035 [Xylariaceae sp. FL1019]|nr:hypothetical protein F5Y18DRAFT_431035 [Xylariaceae sp. FL1019]
MPESFSSSQTMYNGQTSSKPGHYYSTHPSVAPGTQSLAAQRLSTFQSAPHCTPQPCYGSAADSEAAYRARAAAQIAALSLSLP